MIEVTITGATEVQRAILKLAAEVPQKVANALFAEAAEVILDSRENYCPVDLGPLKGSGMAHLPVIAGRDISCTMGYGGPAAPYALSVHENPRAGKTGGWGPKGVQEIAFRRINGRIVPIGAQRKHWATRGQWKYLEQPFLKRVAGFADRILARVLGGQ